MTKKKDPSEHKGRGGSKHANATTMRKGDGRRQLIGRGTGAENRLNRQCKEMIATCFENIGGQEGLDKWAEENRGEFYCRLWVRLIGMNVHISDGTNKTYRTPEEIRAAFALQGVSLEAIEALQRMGRLQEIETRLIDVTPRNNRGGGNGNGDDNSRH